MKALSIIINLLILTACSSHNYHYNPLLAPSDSELQTSINYKNNLLKPNQEINKQINEYKILFNDLETKTLQILSDNQNKCAKNRKKPSSLNKFKQKNIKESIENYKGSCPCPYSTTISGSSCGGRSAWSRPGGEDPICYINDIPKKIIDNFLSCSIEYSEKYDKVRNIKYSNITIELEKTKSSSNEFILQQYKKAYSLLLQYSSSNEMLNID